MKTEAAGERERGRETMIEGGKEQGRGNTEIASSGIEGDKGGDGSQGAKREEERKNRMRK